MTIKTVSFNVSSSHPDFEVAADHCYQVRALRNGINSILRTKYFRYRYGDDADFSIAAEYGLTRANVDSISKKDHDSLRKIVSLHQGIDLPVKVAQSATRSLGASWTSFYRLRKKKIKANIPGYSKKYHVCRVQSSSNQSEEAERGLGRSYRMVNRFRPARTVPEDQERSSRSDGYGLRVESPI